MRKRNNSTDRQFNFDQSWERNIFCSSDTGGCGFLLRIQPRNIIPSDTVLNYGHWTSYFIKFSHTENELFVGRYLVNQC